MAELFSETINEIQRAEEFDGYRLSWNSFPSTRIGAQKLFIPTGCLYTPLNKPEDMLRQQYEPVRCVGQKGRCQAVLNPFCQFEYARRTWVCNMCQQRNNYPHWQQISVDSPPEELTEEYTTIEYQPEAEVTNYPPAFIFVIDTCLIDAELNGLVTAIEQLFTVLPDSIKEQAYIGLITFGRHVQLHQIGFPDVQKVHVFRGDTEEKKHATVESIKKQLNITNPVDEMSKFLLSAQECEDTLVDILGYLSADAWTPPAQHRHKTCTGAAIQVAVALMESLCQGQSARIMVFSGGPATCGPGQVLDTSKEHHMRGHKDITDGKAPYHDKAKEFYAGLAKTAVKNSHVVDLFACCLDQTGIEEQRVLVDHTGGVLILSDSFETQGFSDSFLQIFKTNKYDEGYEELYMAFNAEITVVTSPEIKVKGCIGPVTSMGESSINVADTGTGIGGTRKWSIGGLSPNTTLAFYFEINNKTGENFNDGKGFVQFITTYRDSAGYNVTRTTTLGVLFKDTEKATPFNELKESFDEEASAVLLARLGTYKAEHEYDTNTINWLDKVLIKSMMKCANFQPNDPSSFTTPKSFTFFPTFLYYLRRSPFVRKFGYSPDEISYFRHWLLRSNVTDSMTMINPRLMQFVFDDDLYVESRPVNLDAGAMRDDVILILDSFFSVLLWSGRDVADWRTQGLRDDPEYERVGDLLDQGDTEFSETCQNRFPYPTEIRSVAGGSQERFLLAKVDPSSGTNSRSVPKRVWTDDVSLERFLVHLRQLATQVE